MSQHSLEINQDFSIVILTDAGAVSSVEIDCIMLDNYRGLVGTVTVETMTGTPGAMRSNSQSFTGEHGWLDYLCGFGFVIIPNEESDRSAVIKSINKSKEVKQ